jgi:hypothetical protein
MHNEIKVYNIVVEKSPGKTIYKWSNYIYIYIHIYYMYFTTYRASVFAGFIWVSAL